MKHAYSQIVYFMVFPEKISDFLKGYYFYKKYKIQ